MLSVVTDGRLAQFRRFPWVGLQRRTNFIQGKRYKALDYY